MRTTIWSIAKSCRTCQVKKKRKLKYGHLPSKTVITTHWRTLCVDLVGPYSHKGKDGSVIDFMAENFIWSIAKSCKTCQVNKKRKLKYGQLPPKTVITTPLRVVSVDLVGPYSHKGKDGSVIDFMALTVIDPASSWFKIVELPLVR